MKLPFGLRQNDDVRALWLLAACTLLGGGWYVENHYQRAISESYRQTENLYRESVAAMRLLHQAPALDAVQARVLRDLRHVAHGQSISRTTATLLVTLHASSHKLHTSILQVEPGGADPTPAPIDTQAETASDALRAVGMTIRARGTFRDLLNFVEDLSHHESLVSVSDTEMAVASDRAQAPEKTILDATIHATLYQLQLPADESDVRATTR